ncbi:MAG TPA: putative ABC exporter domain-containing protein, partial [Planctomycetota bacterium]|nr:putative ABC exporter domain-containing protein [Planctomycetota bacterium]
MIAGHPALKLLARRKFIGMLRKQVRRLRTAKGLFLALIGLAAIGAWIWSITSGGSLGRQRLGSGFTSNESVRLIGASIVVMSLISALSFRGLYLPREEIELLFAAPVSRSDVIRYRLWSALGKSLFGSVFFGLIVMRSVPVPLFGFLGAFVAMMTLPVASQIISLFAGDVENRWLRRMPKSAFRVANFIGIFLVLAVFLFPRERDGAADAPTAKFLQSIPSLPFVSAITLPFWPWATLIMSASLVPFLQLACFCAAVWWLLYQACVRIPIDYRELSLET